MAPNIQVDQDVIFDIGEEGLVIARGRWLDMGWRNTKFDLVRRSVVPQEAGIYVIAEVRRECGLPLELTAH